MVQVVKDTLFTTDLRANEPSRANGSGNKFEFPLRPHRWLGCLSAKTRIFLMSNI